VLLIKYAYFHLFGWCFQWA